MKYLILLPIVLIAGATAQQAQQAQQELEIPPFLTGAPPSVVQQYSALLKTVESKTDAQAEADIEAFFRKLGGSYQTKFAQFKQELEQAKAQYKQIHETAVSKFSPEAKEADAKMSAIADNTQLTQHQKGEQIEAIMNSLSPSVRNEIINALSQK